MKEVPGGRYAADENGTIYSLRNNAGNTRNVPRPMRLKPTRDGYLTCNVYEDTTHGVVKRTCFAHRLVALAFHPNPDNKPEVNHKDGHKAHNWKDNLEWATTRENAIHAYAMGLRTIQVGIYKGKFNEEHPKSRGIQQLTLTGEFIRTFPSGQEARRQGFSQGNISQVIAGQRKSHKGFKWASA